MNAFVSGRELNAAFYAAAVAPLLGDVPHAAALLGTGSDVLGYDTPVSTDHGWGPRLLVFVAGPDVERVRRAVDAGLPERFGGHPVLYGWDAVAVRHHVHVGPLGDWLRGHLGVDPRASLTSRDWLTVPQQLLLEVTEGAVYADPDGELGRVRARLARFPPQVRLWMLGCQWSRISQEEAFVGRAAQVGDEIGSRLLAARLVRELMRVGFLLADRYWPYAKWFGTAFAGLPVAGEWGPLLRRVLAADAHPERQAALVAVYEAVGRAHNAAGLTAPQDPAVRPFYARSFLVPDAGRFAAACHERVTDPWLRAQPPIGSVDQWADSTDVLSAIGVSRTLGAAYRDVP